MVQKSLIGESIRTNTRRLKTNIYDHARFNVLTAVLMKIEVFLKLGLVALQIIKRNFE